MSQLLTIVNEKDGDDFVSIQPLSNPSSNSNGDQDTATKDDNKDASSSATTATSSGNSLVQYTCQQFEAAYHCAPSFVARAPGRVNIIGEHIDYNGFGVLPMALQQSVFVATSAEKRTNNTMEEEDTMIQVEIRGTSPKAEPRSYQYKVDTLLSNSTTSTEPPFDASDRDWSHYVLCAFFGVIEALTKEQPLLQQFFQETQTIQLLIHGTVPQGAGVSSSSALVVASALAFLTLLAHESNQPPQPAAAASSLSLLSIMTKTKIASTCARCERWVGTEGGGMDQAISLFATAMRGRYIQFNPTFCHKAIPLPASCSWVVCHSLQESHKRQDAATLFNKRVVECKIGCYWLAKSIKNKNSGGCRRPTSLWELVIQQSGQLSLVDLEELVQKHIPAEITRQELISVVLGDDTPILHPGESMEQLLANELELKSKAGLQVLQVAESYCIRNRLLHVLSETRRVQEFVTMSCGEQSPFLQKKKYKIQSTAEAARRIQDLVMICSGEKSSSTQKSHSKRTAAEAAENNNSNQVKALGDLMCQSHDSCSKLYDCSSPQVDRLQQICMQAPGALGARMTGAGWGGCVISLVETSHVNAFCDHVRTKYYATLPAEAIGGRAEPEYLFVTTPSAGSNVYDVRK